MSFPTVEITEIWDVDGSSMTFKFESTPDDVDQWKLTVDDAFVYYGSSRDECVQQYQLDPDS
jgi:hypothetical protein